MCFLLLCSRQYVVINTHKGPFRYTRLPYGISSRPGIFQREMENLLRNIPGVVVYIDDVLITGSDEKSHLAALEEVLKLMEDAGLHLNVNKCLLKASQVTFLGYKIDAKGLRLLPDKVHAMENALNPKNTTELKAYLGLLTYYGRFLPNLSTVLSPLYCSLPTLQVAQERCALDVVSQGENSLQGFRTATHLSKSPSSLQPRAGTSGCK